MNKIDYKKKVRESNTQLGLVRVEEEGLALRHRQLSAMLTLTMTSQAGQDLADSLNELERDMHTNRETKKRLLREQQSLEQARAAGFDYERPDRSVLNRLLPAVPTGTKEVTREAAISNTASRHWVLATLLGLASYGYVFWLIQVLPVAVVAGAVMFFLSPPATVMTTSLLVGKVISYLVVAGGLVFLAKMPLWINDPARSQRIAHHYLGAEHWNWAQRFWSCTLYSVSSPWIIAAPMVIVPIRFVTGVVLLWAYLHIQDNQSNSPQAIAATARFYGAYLRVMQIIGAAAFVLVAILLIVM